RQHLDHLQKSALVVHEVRAAPRGRPSKLWRTTEKSGSHFPDSHALLATDLIGQMRRVFGEQGLERLVMSRTADQEQLYGSRIAGRKTLKSRLDALAKVRSEEGYMAEIRREPNSDAWLLVENH